MLILALLFGYGLAGPIEGFNKDNWNYANVVAAKGTGSASKEVDDLCPWASELTGSDADGGWFEEAGMPDTTMLCMDGTTCNASKNADGDGCCSCRRNRNGGVGRAKCPKKYPHMCAFTGKENSTTFFRCAMLCILPFGGPRFCEQKNTVEDARCPIWKPTKPDITCCNADVAACNACKSNMDLDKYCELHPNEEGCPEVCCMSMDARCEACRQDSTVEDVCQKDANNELTGCDDIADSTVTSPFQGCDCMSVGDPHITGCRAPEDTCVEKDFMEPGEFQLYKGYGMEVQTRQENAPFAPEFAWNTGVVFTGRLFCGMTIEVDKGSWRANVMYDYPGDAEFRHCKLRTNDGKGSVEEWEGVTQMYAGFNKYLSQCKYVTNIKYNPLHVGGKIKITLYDGSELRFNNFCNTNDNLPAKHVGGMNFVLRIADMGTLDLERDTGLCAADANVDSSSCDPLDCDHTLFTMHGRDGECAPEPPAPTPRPTKAQTCCQKDPSFKEQARTTCEPCRDNDDTFKSCIWDICETCNLSLGQSTVEACEEIVPVVPAVLPTPTPEPTESPLDPIDTPAPTVPDKGFACNSYGDPHFTRLDGSYFDNFNSGESNMFKNSWLRVDTRTEPCYYAPDTTGNKAVALTGEIFCGYSLQYVHGSFSPFGGEHMINAEDVDLIETLPAFHEAILIIKTPGGDVEKYVGGKAIEDAAEAMKGRCSGLKVSISNKKEHTTFHNMTFTFASKPKLKVKIGSFKHPVFGTSVNIVDKGFNIDSQLADVSGMCVDGGPHQYEQLEHCSIFHPETYHYSAELYSAMKTKNPSAYKDIDQDRVLACDNPLKIDFLGRNDVMANCKPSLKTHAERECRKCGQDESLFADCLYDVCASGTLEAAQESVAFCTELYEPVEVPQPTSMPTPSDPPTYWPSPSPTFSPTFQPTIMTSRPTIKVHTVAPTNEPVPPTTDPTTSPVPAPETFAPTEMPVAVDDLCELRTKQDCTKGPVTDTGRKGTIDDLGKTCKFMRSGGNVCKGADCTDIGNDASNPVKCQKLGRKQKIKGAVDLKGTDWGCMYDVVADACLNQTAADVPCDSYNKYRSKAKAKKFCKKIGTLARGCKWSRKDEVCSEA